MKQPGHLFYEREDVTIIARELLGMELVTTFGGRRSSGIITETEAYAGINDRASHAFGGRRTSRTEVMYAAGGTIYVYLCYGMHSLFNIVTNREGIPDAVLIRAIEPVSGLGVMLRRCGAAKAGRTFGVGPGKLSKALGIHYSHSGGNLFKGPIRVYDSGFRVPDSAILAGPRIGVGYAGEDALLPYRYKLTQYHPEK